VLSGLILVALLLAGIATILKIRTWARSHDDDC